MENRVNKSYLCVGTFSKLMLRYIKKDDRKSNSGRFLSPKGYVVTETVIKYLISTLKMGWENDDDNIASMKTMRSELINCKRELFKFDSLKSNKDAIKRKFVDDVCSKNPKSLMFMSDFVINCIDEKKCKQMVDELLRVIRDDIDISGDTLFYILGNDRGIAKSEMVNEKTDFIADCFLLGVWQFIIRERADNNSNGIETLENWYGTESDINNKCYIGTELRRDLWKKLGREITVKPSAQVVKSGIPKIRVKDNHKLFDYDMDTLSKDELESLEFLKNSRILRDLIRACIIGSFNNLSVNYYKSNYGILIVTMNRCKQFVFNHNFAELIKNDQIKLQEWLEQFMKIIDPLAQKESDKEDRFFYSKKVVNNIEEAKVRLEEVYNTLYGSRSSLQRERISSLLSVIKI